MALPVRAGHWKLSAALAEADRWLMRDGTLRSTCYDETSAPLELAIDVDAPIAVVMEERIDEERLSKALSCPAVTAMTATTAYR